MTAERDGAGVGDGSPSEESSASRSTEPSASQSTEPPAAGNDTTASQTTDVERTGSDAEGLGSSSGDEHSIAEPLGGSTRSPPTGDRGRYTLRTATMLALQAVLTAVVVSATVDAARLPAFVPAPLAGLSAGAVTPTVPPFVYTYATLGALGYTFTRVVNVGPTAERLTDWTIRVLAALPLAAGTYLFAALLLPESVTGEGTEASRRLLAGLAFLTGLFVDLVYRRLSQLARRLVGDTGGGSGGAGADGGDASSPDERGGAGADDTRDSPTSENDAGNDAETEGRSGGSRRSESADADS